MSTDVRKAMERICSENPRDKLFWVRIDGVRYVVAYDGACAVLRPCDWDVSAASSENMAQRLVTAVVGARKAAVLRHVVALQHLRSFAGSVGAIRCGTCWGAAGTRNCVKCGGRGRFDAFPLDVRAVVQASMSEIVAVHGATVDRRRLSLVVAALDGKTCKVAHVGDETFPQIWLECEGTEAVLMGIRDARPAELADHVKTAENIAGGVST